jgi:hypothetical protein
LTTTTTRTTTTTMATNMLIEKGVSRFTQPKPTKPARQAICIVFIVLYWGSILSKFDGLWRIISTASEAMVLVLVLSIVLVHKSHNGYGDVTLGPNKMAQ